MKFASVAALVLVAAAEVVSAQQGQRSEAFTDPANLRGERVGPHNGRELAIDEGARGLAESLRRLNTRASLLLIVAHPDDEDGGMLTAYSRGLGARVGSLTLTRGEGGQNAVTGDFGDALGLIRTQELLSADRYLGSDQMFGTEVDFGFSKTKEESFAKWTHQRVLFDAVRAVRLYRPLVLAAVFIGGVTDGHGQHQVSGEITQEVFKAAGDPKVFPELTAEGILPWKPLKVYGRVPMQAITPEGLFDYATGQYTPARFTNYVTGENSTVPPSADVTVHEGEIDPLLSGPGEPPRSYVQFARLGLGLQRTQIGPGARLAPSGAFDISYHCYGSRLGSRRAQPPEKTFFDGIDTSLESIASLSSAPPRALQSDLGRFSQEIQAATKAFNSSHPEALAPQLADAQTTLGKLIYGLEQASFPGKADVLHELRVKQVQLNEAIVQALGLSLDARLASGSADIQTRSTPAVETKLQSHATEPVGIFSEEIDSARAEGSPNSGGGSVLGNGDGSARGQSQGRVVRLLATEQEPTVSAAKPYAQHLETTAALTSEVTRPPFFRLDTEQPVYQLSDPALRNAPGALPALTAWATLRYHGTEVSLGRIVDVGDQPVSIVPPVSLRFAEHARALPGGTPAFPFVADVTEAPGESGSLSVEVPTGWKVDPAAQPLALEASFLIHTPQAPRAQTLHAAANVAGHMYTEGFRAVGYPGLPRTNFYTSAYHLVVHVDLHFPAHKRIGYVAGTGDPVPDALASIGLPTTALTFAELTPARLAQFDTVILGVRTYDAHPELHGAPTQALLNWARSGGNVIVQYQISNFTGADAPYQLSLGSAEKVVDETDPVRLLTASAPLLEAPNRLSTNDFNGWVEERGHGFLQDWDPRYTALTEVHDPGQAPQKGGLITTSVGRGHWTYCAFALYRQLPEAIPGAYRLMVNLIGLADRSPQ